MGEIGPALLNGGAPWCVKCNRPVHEVSIHREIENLPNMKNIPIYYCHWVRYEINCHGERYVEIHYPNGGIFRSENGHV